MCSTSVKKSISVLIGFCLLHNSYQDVGHLFAQTPDFNYYQNHHPFSVQQTHFPVALQSGYSTFSGSGSSSAVEKLGLYPKPVVPVEVVTPAPVAAISSSSELPLPEIVENRGLKDRKTFIPLLKQYLPPDQNEERPNYASPAHG